jgi:hypothetical protein
MSLGAAASRAAAVEPILCRLRQLRIYAKNSPASRLERGRQSPGWEDWTGHKINAGCSLFVPVLPCSIYAARVRVSPELNRTRAAVSRMERVYLY